MTLRLQQHLQNLHQRGDLHAFNAEFKRRRIEAKAQGHGFMSYKAALARLRLAVVAHHMAKRSASTAALMKAVFDPDHRASGNRAFKNEAGKSSLPSFRLNPPLVERPEETAQWRTISRLA